MPALTAAVSAWRSRAKESTRTAESVAADAEASAPVVAWLAAFLITASRLRVDESDAEAWRKHVAAARVDARRGDMRSFRVRCDSWGGDYLRLTAAMDASTDYGALVPWVSAGRQSPVYRQYRAGEQLAVALVDPNADDELGARQLLDEGSQERTASYLRDVLESTPPEAADSQEQITALLSGFLAALDLSEFKKLDPEACERVGRNAADDAVASLRWSTVVGDRIDTTAVTRLLGISRQALAQRLAAGTIHGLPGRRTTFYPTWQFDFDAGDVRSETAQILGEFRGRLGRDVDQLIIAGWMSTPQSELHGVTPIAWVSQGRDTSQLVLAARHSAARAAS